MQGLTFDPGFEVAVGWVVTQPTGYRGMKLGQDPAYCYWASEAGIVVRPQAVKLMTHRGGEPAPRIRLLDKVILSARR